MIRIDIAPLNHLLTAIGALLATQCPPCSAAAPLAKAQPGFYRMMLGEFEVTALNDGVVMYPTARVLPTATTEQIKNGLSENALTDPVGMSYNAFLINTGDELVLIDTGTGGKLDDEPEFHGAGHLIANLRAAGYRPEQVDAILITHRGQDHIGGLTVANERAFPNAIVWAPKSEFDAFLDSAKTSSLLARAHNNEKVKAWVDFTRELFEPYIKAGKFRSFERDQTLVPGIRSFATHGHTPGHTSYIVESRGRTLIVMGDLVLMDALQFAHPSLGSSFDVDTKAAAIQRQRVLQMASEKDYWLAGGHLSFPGIGHVRAESGGYVWIPTNYTIPDIRSGAPRADR
jgi:glyoxylase-like metal-dependent hydrolase (beta-lactamase superfamily II)